MTGGTNQRTRIGIDVTSAVTQGGGIGRYTRELIRALVKVDNQAHDFVLFSAKQPAKLPVENPLPIKPNVIHKEALLPDRWLYRLWYRLKIPLPVQRFTGPLNLYHSPDFVLPPLAGSIPSLLTIHDLSFLYHPEAFTPPLINFLNQIVPKSVAGATHILADSQSTKTDLIQQWDIDETKITVLYSGVSKVFRPETDSEKIETVREKYKLGSGPFVLSVGTLQPRKNYGRLIRAFKGVVERQPHNLVIAGGGGWLYDRILEEAKLHGLEERVQFLGFVEDLDLPALYSEASLFTFPSLYEGFGLPILEAMACGVPVLSSNASCLPEVVEDAGILLDPKDETAWTEAILYLLENPSERTRLVAAGFLRARQFTWEKAAEKLIELYSRLLN